MPTQPKLLNLDLYYRGRGLSPYARSDSDIDAASEDTAAPPLPEADGTLHTTAGRCRDCEQTAAAVDDNKENIRSNTRRDTDDSSSSSGAGPGCGDSTHSHANKGGGGRLGTSGLNESHWGPERRECETYVTGAHLASSEPDGEFGEHKYDQCNTRTTDAAAPGASEATAEAAVPPTAARYAAMRSGYEEVRVYLHQLDALRAECDARGAFLEAQACMDRMRDVNARFCCRLRDDSAALARRIRGLLAASTRRAEAAVRARYEKDRAELDRVLAVRLRELEGQHNRQLQAAEARQRAALCAQRKAIAGAGGAAADGALDSCKGETDAGLRALAREVARRRAAGTARRDGASEREALRRRFAEDVSRLEAEVASRAAALAERRDAELAGVRGDRWEVLAEMQRLCDTLRDKVDTLMRRTVETHVRDPLALGTQLYGVGQVILTLYDGVRNY